MVYGFNDKKEKIPFVVLEKTVIVSGQSGGVSFMFDATDLATVGINSDSDLKKYIVLSSMQTYGDDDTYWCRTGGTGERNQYPDISIYAIGANNYRVQGFVYSDGNQSKNRVRIVMMRIE